jgi:DNA-binding response OmpR family regulator
MTGVGRRAAKDLPPVEWVQVATHAAVITQVEAGGLDLVVLDGEAGKSGGIGLCRQLKDEIFQCPPVLLLLGRREDRWLAASADPDGVVTAPLDPLELTDTVARMLRATA